MKFNYKKRLNKLVRHVAKLPVEGLLVTNLVNIRYLTGFRGSNAYLLISDHGAQFLTDFRYTEVAEKQITFADVQEIGRTPFDFIADLCDAMHIQTLGFEQAHVSYDIYLKLGKSFGVERIQPISGAVESLRLIKDEQELAVIKKAGALSNRALKHIMTLIGAGVTERVLQLELELFMNIGGAEDPAFASIVAFGKHASMPHHKTSTKKLKSGDMVLIDFGARVAGYNSDLTRTMAYSSITGKLKEVYAIVLEARQAAIDRVRPGRALAAIDGAAREVIASYGYGQYFGHGLGHGLGLDVHELPHVTPNAQGTCRKGMVFTIEPGIYIPGWGGVRIEDDIVVTSSGCQVLTQGCARTLKTVAD